MTQRVIAGSDFEERLLTHLRAEVAERGAAEVASADRGTVSSAWRRRTPHMAIGAAAASAAAAVVLVLSAGGDATAAFAVEPQPEGMVSVEIRSLEDAKGLEGALDEAGMHASVNYLATGMACKEPRFQSVPWPNGDQAILSGLGSREGPFTFRISRDAVGSGQTLVITASPSPEALLDAQVKIAEGAVAPCEPVPAP